MVIFRPLFQAKFMFGTIRKHSKALWIVIVILTVISFIFWGGFVNKGGGGDGGNGSLGSISGVPVTRDNLIKAIAETRLHYFFQSNGRWPGPEFDEKREAYFWLIFVQKQQDFGIHIDEDTVAK